MRRARSSRRRRETRGRNARLRGALRDSDRRARRRRQRGLRRDRRLLADHRRRRGRHLRLQRDRAALGDERMRAKIGHQLMAILVALGRILGDHAIENARDLGIDVGIDFAHIGNFRLDDFEHQAERRFIRERHAAGEHLEHHDAERKNIRALIDRLAQARLRATDSPACRRIRRSSSASWKDRGSTRAMPKSAILISPRLLIIRLPGLMSRWTTPRSCAVARPIAVCWITSRLLDRKLALALEHPAERFAFDELHDEIRLAFVVADEIDLDDVRIVERRHAARFAQEAFLDRLSCASESASTLIAT